MKNFEVNQKWRLTLVGAIACLIILLLLTVLAKKITDMVPFRSLDHEKRRPLAVTLSY